MIANIRARRIIITALVTSSLALALVLILIPSPDLSLEQELQRQISHLSLRIEQAEKINVERKDDLQRLFQQFSRITHNLLKVGKSTQCRKKSFFLEKCFVKSIYSSEKSYFHKFCYKDVKKLCNFPTLQYEKSKTLLVK